MARALDRNGSVLGTATGTFSGIRPTGVPGFIGAQLIGAAVATALFRWLIPTLLSVAPDVVVPPALDQE